MTSNYTPKKYESACLCKGSLSQQPNAGTAQVPVSRRMGKWTVVSLYNGMPLRNKRKEPLTHGITWMNSKISCWVKSSLPQKAHSIWFYSYRVLQSSKLVSNDRDQDNGCFWGWMGEEIGKGLEQRFWGDGNVLWLDSCLIVVFAFCQTHQSVL